MDKCCSSLKVRNKGPCANLFVRMRYISLRMLVLDVLGFGESSINVKIYLSMRYISLRMLVLDVWGFGEFSINVKIYLSIVGVRTLGTSWWAFVGRARRFKLVITC